MASEERDRIFDKALARHLRSAAPAGEAAPIPDVTVSQSRACPDSETLAAYHERSLLPGQLNSLKEHIVGCANCQTVLAHLETTDDIPLQAFQKEEATATATEAVMAARNSETFSAATAPVQSERAASVTPPRKSRRLLLIRGARWQWLAPAGAIAAGLLVWIALHENQPLPLPSLKQVQVATNQVPPPPVPSDSRAMQEASRLPKPALTKPPSAADESAISNGRVASGAARQIIPTPSGTAGARSAHALVDKEAMERKDRERDTSADQLTAASHADLDAKNPPDALRKKEEAPSQDTNVQTELAQSQNSPTQNQSNNYVLPRVPGPTAPNQNQMQSPRKGKSTTAAAAPAPVAPPPQPAGVGGVASNSASLPSMKVARAISNPRLISPPGSSAIWRVGLSGLIEFSKDGGSSWSRQTSGVLADLLTGSAPSDQICWIVGRVGAILLTADGGAHWKPVQSPLTEDLGGVRASDALHAAIWYPRSAKTFETTDGGLTWKPIPNP
jgi:hypothetical protein